MSKALGAMSRPETTPEEEEEELIFCSLVGVLLRAAPAKKKIIHRSTLSHRKKIQIPSTSAVPGTSIEVLVLANHSTAQHTGQGTVIIQANLVTIVVLNWVFLLDQARDLALPPVCEKDRQC